MSILPNGTVTFLFTDIEGSTRLARENIHTWEAYRKRHNDILQAAMVSNNGYTFQIIGDAFCAAFSTASEALEAAIKLQTGLFTEEWGDTPIKVRVGIHTGKAEIQESGQYIGYSTLSHVQRLMSAGHGGQTLLSQVTRDLVKDDLITGVTLLDMGEHRLKDLIQPEHIYQVNIPNLPVAFPPLKTLDVQLNNLPAQVTPFVGREREIAAVLGLLRSPEVRLVTLTGTGGTGKTRLSIQVAAELLDEFQHGVWFVELASITDPGLVLQTIASTLKVKETAGTSIEQALHDYLQKRNLLIVIDNFEQVVSAAPVISGMLNAAPNVKVLVSSREVLRLRGEHDYPVPPLGLPETRRKRTVAVFAQYEAIALFVQHARAANPAFDLDEENATLVSEICMRLDGLPLAIELAAARSRLLKPAVMLEKLKSRLNVLTSGARDLPHRQQTMRGAIDWSYNLLDEAEKVLFTRLGIFIGGWTLESAEAVCNIGSSLDLLSVLESLLDKSLIRQYEGSSGETRFSMLEVIREYAFEKLSQCSELSMIQQAYADYIEQLLNKIKSGESGPEEEIWHARLDDDLNNVRSTVDWALEHQQPALIFAAGKLYQYWFQRTNYREPLDWLERGLALKADSPVAERALATSLVGNYLGALGDNKRAKEFTESALALYREAGDAKGIANCLCNLGNSAWQEKDFEKARQFYEQSLEVDPEPNTWGYAMVFNNLGSLAMIRGDWQESRDYYMRSRKICEQLGAEAGISYTDWFLGRLALAQRKLDEAQVHFESMQKASWLNANPLLKRWTNSYLGYIKLLSGNREDAQRLLDDAIQAVKENLEQSPDVDDAWLIFEGKARLELSAGRAERAALLFGAAWTQREKTDYDITEAERPDYEAHILEIRSVLGDAHFDEAFQKGRTMTLRDAITFANEQFYS